MNSKQCESSLDTVILLSDYEETIPESQKSKSTKYNHKKSSKNHSEKSSSNNSTTKSHKTSNINISQQIQVKNKDFQCVINLNTNVYEHKSRFREKSSPIHRSTEEKWDTKRNTKTTSKEHKTNDKYCHKSRESRKKDTRNRNVPSCNRRSCWNSIERLQERSRRRQIFTDAQMLSENYEIHENKKKNTLRKKNMEQKVQNIAQHHSKINAKTPRKPIQFRILLSPISPTPFQEGIKDDISYDEISSGSLDISKDDGWEPRTCKHRRRHSKHCKHKHKHRSSKLDTLIKRTKERERIMVENSRNWFTSTPIGQEFSSADFPMTCSDMDMSFNSVSTILHESQPCFQKENFHARSDSEKLSNIKEDTFPTENLQASFETVKLSNYQPYSPSSTIKEVYTPTKESIDYQLIKEEPKIKIEVYSPTHSPESPKLYYLTDVKKEIEIKPKPLFSAELSPISKNNNVLDFGNKFCKIENVKTELMFSSLSSHY